MQMNFELNLCRCLSHSLVYESRLTWLPVADARCGGDPAAPPAGQSTAETMQAFIKYLPQLMSTIIPQLAPMAQAGLKASEAVSPGQSALQTNLFKMFAPQLNETSQAIDASNKLSGAKADLSVLTGPGRESALAAEGIDRTINPEFYAGRTASGNALASLVGGGLTPNEEEAINRSLARDNFAKGLSAAPTATSTVSNAMRFGDAARQRQLQGVGAMNSFLPVSRAGIDPAQVALGRPSINTGQSQFIGVDKGAGAAGTDTANNLFNQIAGFQTNAMNINAQRRDSLDRVSGLLGSLPT